MLLPPFNLGFVGLAGVAVVMNMFQAVWLWVLLERKVLTARTSEPPCPRLHGGASLAAPVGRRSGQSLGRAVAQRHAGHAPASGTGWREALRLAAAAVHAARVGAVDDQPPAGDRLLARQPAGAVRGRPAPRRWASSRPAVKYVDGLNVIPAYFTAAIFPMMSRYAQHGPRVVR